MLRKVRSCSPRLFRAFCLPPVSAFVKVDSCNPIPKGLFMRRNQVSLAFCLLAVLASLFLLAVPTVQAQNVRPVLITQNVDESKLVALAGNTRPEAKKQNDRGLVADDFPMEHMLLQLKRSPEQERDLLQFIDELQDSSSPNFHHWLTAKEFGKRFGLSQQDLGAITRWLQSHGFKVNVVYENGLLLDFSGTAGQVRAAFHTKIHELNVKGEKHIANMSDPRIPAALASAVVGVVSLNDFMPHPMYKPRSNYSFPGSYGEVYAMVPADLATIYNLNPLFKATPSISGQGQTIVVIEDSDVYFDPEFGYFGDDWNTFRRVFGLSSYGGTLKQVQPTPPSGPNNCIDPGATGDDVEVALDVEWASAAAPSAAIEVASCANTATTFGGLIALQNLLNESSTPPALMSMSYGGCETYNGASVNAAFSAAYQQAVTEGVSVFVSTGDSGPDVCDRGGAYAAQGISVSGLASTPYNVAVGGTDFGDSYANTNSTYWGASNTSTYGSALSYVPEIPWNDSCASMLVATTFGYTKTYGAAGFCNSLDGGALMDVVGGSGGPSGCATGTPSSDSPGVVSGTCAGWPKPSWQSLVGNPKDGVRDTPDVSLFSGDGLWSHYYLLCISDPSYSLGCTGYPFSWAGAGGTSFASPIMAGIQALVNQKAGSRQGNPNPTYYKLAASEYGAKGNSSCNSTLGNAAGSSCIFYDVTLGDNDLPCYTYFQLVQGQIVQYDCYMTSGSLGVLSTSNSTDKMAYGTTTGWDFATGIGSVNAANLVNNWPGVGPNFALSPSPNAVTIMQGSSGTSTIAINPLRGFSGSVTLSAAGLPSGVKATFSPATATAGSTSTLTLKASATAATGTVTVTITGKSGTLTNSTTITLTVNQSVGNFTLTAAPATLKIAEGGWGISTLTVVPTGGFSGNVALVASGLPSGVNASFSPNPATPASPSTLMMTVSGSAAVGTATITVTGTYTGTSVSLVHTKTVKLTVIK